MCPCWHGEEKNRGTTTALCVSRATPRCGDRRPARCPSLGCPVTKTTLDLQTKISSANDDASTMLVVTPKGVVLNIVRGTKVCSASISGSL